uniref:DUF834 domain-containing protein n=1 Tax=Oryza sativa subsp. japonica TaxID=39947 RepID=Q5Z7R6_ORYSJ|nr:hypothetical protein [Oryza sativa Japonica Group]
MASSPACGERRIPATGSDGGGVDGVALGLANPTEATARLGDGSNGGERLEGIDRGREVRESAGDVGKDVWGVRGEGDVGVGTLGEGGSGDCGRGGAGRT